MKRDLWELIPYRNEQDKREPQEPTLKDRGWGTHTQNRTCIFFSGPPVPIPVEVRYIKVEDGVVDFTRFSETFA
jgi:hypothetical protein